MALNTEETKSVIALFQERHWRKHLNANYKGKRTPIKLIPTFKM